VWFAQRIDRVIREERNGLPVKFVGGTGIKLEIPCECHHVRSCLRYRLADVCNFQLSQEFRVREH
jgi:hypothetical protein